MVNKVGAHSIHSSAKCVAYHMPRIAKSAESGDIHSRVFVALLPRDTLENPDIPNSCQTCHKHKNEDLQDLQRRYDEQSKRLPGQPGAPAAASTEQPPAPAGTEG